MIHFYDIGELKVKIIQAKFKTDTFAKIIIARKCQLHNIRSTVLDDPEKRR